MKIGKCELQRMHRPAFAIAILQFAICSSLAAGENWPEFRGPTGQGISDSTGLPLTWSETDNVKWKMAIPGTGWSSPVIWGDQVWMTTANDSGTKRWAVAVDRDTGKIVHHVKVFDVPVVAPQHGLNSHASPSPVIEEGRVYVHFGTYGTACLDTRTGQVLWQRRDLNLDHQVGPGSSPLLFENLLIVHCDGTDVQYAIALDKRTGQTVWKTARTAELSHLSTAMHKASCTPVLVSVGGQDQLLSLGAHSLYGYEPRSGRELWKVRFVGYSNVARPVTDGQIAIFSTGYDKAELIGLRLGGAGDVTDSHLLWTYGRNAPSMPSPVLVDGLLYVISDSGIATCLEAATGQELWKQRIGGEFSASALYADGRIHFFDRQGKTTVIAPGRIYKPLAVNKLDDGFMASAAVAGSALYLRTRTHLYRVEEIAK